MTKLRNPARLSLVLILSVGFSVIANAQNPPPPPPPAAEYDPQAWKEFVSPEGGFSVKMAGTPELKKHEADAPSGKVPFYVFGAETDTAAYLVLFSDIPDFTEGPDFAKRAYDAGRDKLLADHKDAKLLSEGEAVSDGIMGREWLVEGGGLVTRLRAYLVRGRLYQVMLVTRPNVAFETGRPSPDPGARTGFYEDISKRFFDSFKLLPANPAGAAAREKPLPGDPQGPPTGTQAEGEVDRLLSEIRDREIILGNCGEEQECKPLRGPVFNGKVIKGDVVAGRIISKPQPAYPPIAKAARASGTVAVLVVIDEEGKVVAAQAESGHPLLQAAAVRAARELRLAPTLLDGKPVKVSGIIRYNFVLQ